MVIKVGVNGFGRIGRIISRACLQNPDLQLTAINDPAISVEYISYLIKFDSTHGKLNRIVTHSDDEIVIDGHHIKVFHEKLPPRIPWYSAGVQYVIEASGMFTSYEKASGHLTSNGVKRVIVTAPSTDIPMIIMGVNACNLCPEHKVISCASSTLYCLAPIVKVLEDNFGVEEGFITSIHAMTPSLKPLDGLCLRGKHWRDHRSIHQNIIPASTGACKALGKILPQVKDKLSGLAFRVPIVNVSVLDLTVKLRSITTLQEVVKYVQLASKTTLKNIIKVSSEECVSSDFNGETSSCIFDEYSSLQLKPNFFKFVCWYENEYSYACRVVDTVFFSDKQILEICNEMVNLGQKFVEKQNVKQETESLKKGMSNVCNCKLGLNPEIASNVSKSSEVKTRSPYALFIQKQSSLANRTLKLNNDTKTDELFKIWKDNSENSKPSVNRRPFFQSYTGIPPKKIECYTQARLENVKREFTKMVNITENLLNKTYSNQSNVQSLSMEAMKCLNGIKARKDLYREKPGSSEKHESYSPVEECGHKKCFTHLSYTSQTLNEHCIDKDDVGSLVSYEKDRSEYSVCNSNITKDSRNFEEISGSEREFFENNENKDKYLSKFDTEGYSEKRVNEFKPQSAKSTSNLMGRLAQNIQVKCVCKIKKGNCFEKEKKPNETRENANADISKPDCKHLSFQKQNKDISEINHFKNMEDTFVNSFIINKHKSITEKSNIKIIDDELRKRNIVLVDSPFVAVETENELCDEDNNNSIAEIDKIFNDTHSKQNLEGITKETVTTVSEKTSNCTNPDNDVVTTINNDVYGNRQDIYDKLDSASESNSINSFEINERKSQVIQITDLTNSLEDLARLDKICRIIEISDELSDKLFSALDNNHSNELKKKRWSFKDLCARIKLDEFCNTVFGGKAM